MLNIPHLSRWLILIVALAIIVSVAVVSWSLRPVDETDTTSQLLRVEEGTSVGSIATDLADRDLVRSSLAFNILARLRGTTAKVGLYHIARALTPAEILTLISSGSVSEKTVTLLEGWRAEEIAETLLVADLVESLADFQAAAIVGEQTPPALVARFGLEPGDSLEGFLYPDTYRFATDKDAAAIVAKLIANFMRRTADLDLNYNDVILASIVEREAIFDEDRAGIAGVYTNRLSIGMKLDADPTVQYAKATNSYPNGCHSERLESSADDPRVEESRATSNDDVNQLDPSISGSLDSDSNTRDDRCEWWPEITTSDYNLVESPYNTYRTNGLPPTPIANPGLASLKAAADSEDHNFFYFMHDREGYTHFARDAAGHMANKRQFLR